MRKELKARKKWEEKDSRAVDRISQEKKDFRKSGIMKKVVSLQNERRKLGKQTKSLVHAPSPDTRAPQMPDVLRFSHSRRKEK